MPKNALILEGLIVRKGNVEGVQKPKLVVGYLSVERMIPKSHQVMESEYTPFSLRLSSGLGLETEDAEAGKAEEAWRWAQPTETFMVRLSEFSCGSREKCPSYSLWFPLPLELLLGEFFPFSGLPISGLM